MPSRPEVKDTPSSVTQLAAALAALGLHRGANTPAEHAAEARRLGGEDAYRVRLANTLLGAAQTEALLADALPIGSDARRAAYEQQLKTAGAADDPTKRIRFLRWQTLRVSGPLREIAQNVEAGPIPLAAAWAADGLQQLLDVIADSQNVTPADVDRLAGPVTDELPAARQALVNAIGNVDILLQLLDAIAWRRSRSLADCAGAPVRVSRGGQVAVAVDCSGRQAILAG